MRSEPEGSNEMDVLSTVVPGPPADKVVPAIENLVGFAVKVWPPTVKTWLFVVMMAGAGVGRGIVLVPMRSEPEGSNEMDVLSTVMPGPPADNVVPAIENLVGFAVKV